MDNSCSATPGYDKAYLAQTGSLPYSLPFPEGSEIRTRPELTAHFNLHNESQVIIIDHRNLGNTTSLSIAELESILRFAKIERTRQKKEAEKATRKNLKYIQSL